MKLCPSCGVRKGTRSAGWEPILFDDQLVGFTCPACPEWNGPIRRIETRGRVRFQAVVDTTPPGARQRKQAKRLFATLDEARQFVDEVRAQVAKTGGLSTTETVAQLAERWLRSKSDVREGTRRNYREQLVPVIRKIGEIPVRDLTSADLRDLVAWMGSEGAKRSGKGLGAQAIKHALGRLATALDMAVDDGIVERNVARSSTIKRPRQAKRVGRALEHWPTDGRGADASCSHLQTFRTAADGDRLAAAWRLSLSGLTRADVMGLHWGDLDLNAGTVTIRRGRVPVGGGERVDVPKSEQRRRTIPFETMQPGTVALLRAYTERLEREREQAGSAWSESPFVFVDEIGVPIRPRVFSERFTALCKSAGVPAIRLHALRHTLAFLLHALGVAPADAAALLGHTLEIHLSTYMPESGETGIAAAAKALASMKAA